MRASGGPASLALEDAGLTAHHGQRHARSAPPGPRSARLSRCSAALIRGVSARHRSARPSATRRQVTRRRSRSISATSSGCAAIRRAPVACSPSCEHVDDEQQAHHRSERAVLGGTEQPGRHDREAVRRDVHDGHRDGDAGAAAQPAPRFVTPVSLRAVRQVVGSDLTSARSSIGRQPVPGSRRVVPAPAGRPAPGAALAWVPRLGPGQGVSYDMARRAGPRIASGTPRRRFGAP